MVRTKLEVCLESGEMMKKGTKKALSHLPDERTRRRLRGRGEPGMSPEGAQTAGTGPARSLERANRTRFPFFSDVKGDHRLVLSAVETVVLALIFAVSLLGNVSALVLVARRRRRGTTVSLVLNLFCADLLFTSAIPPVLAEILICTLVWPSVAGEISWDVSFVTLNFLVPGLLIVISYSKILQITKASRKRLTMSLAYSESHQIRVSQQDFRLFRTLFLLMISFFIMWSPIIITILLILIQNFQQNLVIWPSLFFWVVAFTFANSAVNPILYNLSLFRNEWRKIFQCCFFPEKGAMFTDTSVRRNDLSVISS
ncbi:omega-3 fatty acid receptor 1 [Camelus ferus]|nr:omega-3 fatty acid receptor 1 [Camelus ferus]